MSRRKRGGLRGLGELLEQESGRARDRTQALFPVPNGADTDPEAFRQALLSESEPAAFPADLLGGHVEGKLPHGSNAVNDYATVADKVLI